MEYLSSQAHAAAREFVMASARPLDQALWRFHFEGGPADDVWRELRAFRNDDGGFGQALEPDLRAPESSVLATTYALDMAVQLGDPSHELVTDAVEYLIGAFDDKRGVWRFLPKEMTPAPHAPWWDQAQLDDTFDGFVVNPRAKVVAHLMWAGRSQGVEIVAGVLPQVIATIDDLDAPLSVNDLECIHALGERLDGDLGVTVRRSHDRLAEASVARDDEAWAGYGVRPLDVVHDPSRPLHGRLSELVGRHLDFEIERQSADGSWPPTWSWFGAFPDAWPVAETEWSGHLTVETVRVLRRFGRVAD
jgi:hypothetical protein